MPSQSLASMSDVKPEQKFWSVQIYFYFGVALYVSIMMHVYVYGTYFMYVSIMCACVYVQCMYWLNSHMEMPQYDCTCAVIALWFLFYCGH